MSVVDTISRAELLAENERLREMLGRALGTVKTMQATLEDIYSACKEYADAPTLSPATALGIVRKVERMAAAELAREVPLTYKIEHAQWKDVQPRNLYD